MKCVTLAITRYFPRVGTVNMGIAEHQAPHILALNPVGKLPDDTLKRLYENDASDRVRSLAFQRFLEGQASSVDEMRKALEAGLAVSNEAVQTEARRRLDSLLGGQGIDTSLQ